MDGGVDQGPWLQERVGGGVGAMAIPKKGEGWVWVLQRGASQGRGQGRVGLAVGGGARALVAGGWVVGARAPGTEQISYFCRTTKSREGVREGLAWRRF